MAKHSAKKKTKVISIANSKGEMNDEKYHFDY